MQVSKWGNSLAVRLPASVVEALKLKEGDEVEITIAGEREFSVAKDRSREEALEVIRKNAGLFPKGYRFRREDAYASDDDE